MEATSFDEILELAWVQRERGENVTIESLSRESGQELAAPLRDMERAGLVTLADAAVAFTGEGEQKAAVLVRCHRLAERLLADVLSVRGEVLEAQACEFEHIMSPEVTESICTLLGHPTTCPHGMPIPPGECCKRDRSELESIVVSLDKLPPGEKGRVMYVETKKHERLDKLASFGLVPGAVVSMHQRQPSIVVRIGETQLAMDEFIARCVQVQRMPDKGNTVAQNNTAERFTRRRRRRIG
jgi:DtxR family Mn-dependent transcriptional regulator